MDWTVGTFGTVGNDALDAGTLGDRLDSGDRLVLVLWRGLTDS